MRFRHYYDIVIVFTDTFYTQPIGETSFSDLYLETPPYTDGLKHR